MFSIQQKRQIADAVQRILRETGHPELPPGEINFRLRVDGAKPWSWADICNNGAVSACHGRPTPQPPADGEVAEVAAWLRLFCSEEYESRSHDPDVAWLTRAAELLEQRHPAPLPVSERLPGPEDCDAEGRFWVGRSESEDWSADWTLATPEAVAVFCEFSPQTVWLPANALPTPEAKP